MAFATGAGILGAKLGEKILGLKSGGGAIKTSAGKVGASKKLKSMPLNGANLTSYGKMMMKKKGGSVRGKPVKRKRGGRVTGRGRVKR